MPPYIGYIKYNSVEHEAIFKTVRTIGVNETYVTLQEDIYAGATARLHADNQVSEKIPTLRGGR